MKKKKSNLLPKHMDEFASGLLCFQDFVDDGIVEYLDVNEKNDSLVAVYES